jgi:TonB family protein
MDIETRLNLRSFIKPDITPILKAITGALFVHLLFGLDWSLNENSSVAEIPEWVNIKLVSGFEVIDKKEKHAQSEERKEVVKKTNVLPIKKEKSETKQVESVEKLKELPLTSTTTFVAADSRPYMLENEKPVYPATARRRGMQGVVLLSVKVNKEGYVEKIAVLQTSGFRVLDRSALKSVESWRFIPAKSGNENIASQMEIPIRFILNNV